MTDAKAAPVRTAPSRAQLWAELTALFVGVPLAMAFLLPPQTIYLTLGATTLVGLLLLAATPSFRWRSLVEGWRRRDLPLVLLFAVGTAAVTTALALAFAPTRLFGLATARPELWLAILALYPLLSALPQELLFRVLFFERYGRLFGAPWVAILVNAALFGLAHLFYWNWIAVGLSTLGGAVFAYAYAVRRSFPLAAVLHALGGQILFTVGLGVFFYHGAVAR